MPDAPLPGLVVDGLTKSYGNRTLWRDLTMRVPPGCLMALTGRSGSGKSTLLNCLGLLEAPDKGRIVLNGSPLARCSGRRARLFRRHSVGYLFQNYALIDAATVRQNLAVVRDPKRTVDEVLQACGLKNREDEYVFRLSGGEQQRVAMARLLLKSPPLVLADEPTGALDHENAEMIVAHLTRLAADGSCVVVATHSDAVADACHRIVNLDEMTINDTDTSGTDLA